MSIRCTYIYTVILLVSTLIGCVAPLYDSTRTSDMLVRVGDEVLTRKQLVDAMPLGLTRADSLLFATHYIEEWTSKALLYQQAQRNVVLSSEISKKVDDYRRELIIYEYQKQLLNEKIEQEIVDSVVYEFYEANKDKFVLKRDLVKGLYIKVPEDAPQLDELKQWYTSTDLLDIENIEKYSLRNTLVYEYFYDKWLEFDLLFDNIPYKIESVATFLKNTPSLAHYDNGYWYLINISEYKQVGELQPYEYAQTQIKDILINQRKKEFFQELYQSLYQQASHEGAIEYAQESINPPTIN